MSDQKVCIITTHFYSRVKVKAALTQVTTDLKKNGLFFTTFFDKMTKKSCLIRTIRNASKNATISRKSPYRQFSWRRRSWRRRRFSANFRIKLLFLAKTFSTLRHHRLLLFCGKWTNEQCFNKILTKLFFKTF